MKENSERERKWCKLVIHSIELNYITLFFIYDEQRRESKTESKTEITNSLTNLISTRGMSITNSLNYTYTNGSRFTHIQIILN